LINCFVGCKTEDVLSAIGMTTADLFERTNGNGTKQSLGREVAVYDYTDEAGKVLFRKKRFDPKDFRLCRPDGTWGIEGVRRVIYNLPAVRAMIADGGTIYVVEGEKDADDINAIEDGNFVATCNPEGASKNGQKPKWKPDYSEVLRGAHVVIIQDKDDPGRAHARHIAASLEGVAATVRIVEAKEGKDAADHLAGGHRLEDLVPVTDDHPPTQITQTQPHFMDLRQVPPEPVWLVKDVVTPGDKAILHGPKQTGKTLLGIALAIHYSHGKTLLDRFTIKHDGNPRTIYIDEENGRGRMFSRLRRLLAPHGLRPEGVEDKIFIASKQRIHSDKAARWKWIHDQCRDLQPGLVIFDTIRAIYRGRENEADDVVFFTDLLDDLQEDAGQPGLVLLAHPGKDPDRGIRGSSRWGDMADVEMGIRGVPGRPEVRLVSWTKHRDDGDEPAPFSFQFRDVETEYRDGLVLELATTTRSDLARDLKANHPDLSVRDIADRTGLGFQSVAKALKHDATPEILEKRQKAQNENATPDATPDATPLGERCDTRCDTRITRKTGRGGCRIHPPSRKGGCDTTAQTASNNETEMFTNYDEEIRQT